MAGFILSSSFLVLLLAFSKLSISEGKSAFSFASSGENSSFKSKDITLFGDAKLIDGGSSIQLTDSVSHGGGRVVYKKPIEFLDAKTEYRSGFRTVFSFSISPGRGGRIGFVAFPVNGTIDHSLFQVKLDISENFTKSGDSNVSVIVNGVSEKISNFTISSLEKEKKLLYVWLIYQPGSRLIEVRSSESKSFRSSDHIMYSWVDLPEIMKDEDKYMVGVESYSGNFNLHSWSLETSRFSKHMHSYAALMVAKLREEEEAKKRRRERILKIVTRLVMTFGSTVLVFFAMMHIWAAFKRNNLSMVMQEECRNKTKEFEYEKMEVVMSKAKAKQEKK